MFQISDMQVIIGIIQILIYIIRGRTSLWEDYWKKRTHPHWMSGEKGSHCSSEAIYESGNFLFDRVQKYIMK
jgi:hypothetical protein